MEETTEERVVIRNRRTAKGPLKPLIFFSLQVILLELISYVLFNLFYNYSTISILFIVGIQIVSFMVMINSYKRVMRRQHERDAETPQESVVDTSEHLMSEAQ